jgi:2-polyprenyl-6-hydroxyphenyl methylase/3-demethylubiquinone-9 3-methyltransferase
MESWARAAGLTLRELVGMHYNPLTRRYTLGPGVDVNYLALAERSA